MKNLAILLFCMPLLMGSCKRQDENWSFITRPGLTKSFTTGNWRLIVDDEKVKDTASLPYEVNFKDNNTLVAHHGKDSYAGKWSVNSSYGTDDAPPEDAEFCMTFTSGVPYKIALLNHCYFILERTSTRLELKMLDAHDPGKIIFVKQATD